MEVFPGLLPPSFTAKAEPLLKDGQKQGQQQNKNKKSAKNNNTNTEQDELTAATGELTEVERRKGDDRRCKQTNRGRWLESRNRNDRRATDLAIFVKI